MRPAPVATRLSARQLRLRIPVALALASAALGTCAHASDEASYVEEANKAPVQLVSGTLLERQIKLWADMPEYSQGRAEINLTTTAKLLSAVQPTYPPVLIPLGRTATVQLSAVVGRDGQVEAARVFESDDHRFDQAALEAVRKWKFSPAESSTGKERSFVVIPIIFEGGNIGALPLQLEVPPPRFEMNRFVALGSSGPGPFVRYLTLRINLEGPCAAEVRAARLLVTAAEDGAGHSLLVPSNPGFLHPTVGTVSAADFTGLPVASVTTTLREPTDEGRSIKLVRGTLELVVPGLDAAATVQVGGIAAVFGKPLDSPLLRDAGVSVTLFDETSCARFEADKALAGGPGYFDSGPMYGHSDPRLPPPPIPYKGKIKAGDIALGIVDPEEKLIGLEFRDHEGKSLHYNHHGWYHASGPDGKRFDIYHLEPKDVGGVELVLWLRTDRSMVRMPVSLANLPAPPEPKSPVASPKPDSTKGP